eukprot:m.134016 g.134016  ORF g.134016 m.134016 type:complete len:54 (-) comp22517_c0_seq1:214-375(-)
MSMHDAHCPSPTSRGPGVVVAAQLNRCLETDRNAAADSQTFDRVRIQRLEFKG